MTHGSPTWASRRLDSANGLLTPSQGSTPRCTRSSNENSPGSVLSSQALRLADLFGRPGGRVARWEGLLRLARDTVAGRLVVRAFLVHVRRCAAAARDRDAPGSRL